MAMLKNRSRRAQTYNLPHDTYCTDECRCVEVKQHLVHHDSGTGVVGIAEQPKQLAASITFLAGETKAGLPDTILTCPDVQGAIGRRELAVIQERK
jgi:hypothetical protein